MLALLLFNPKRYIKNKVQILILEKIGNSNILARDSARELGLGPWVSYPTLSRSITDHHLRLIAKAYILTSASGVVEW